MRDALVFRFSEEGVGGEVGCRSHLYVLSGVEDTVSLLRAHEAPARLRCMAECTCLAEVMFTLGDHLPTGKGSCDIDTAM